MTDFAAEPKVLAVASDAGHNFSKPLKSRITLVAGLGVEGDAHFGKTVQHLSRIAIDPTVPNIRQVHLIHAELFDDLKAQGFDIAPGQMGENITTRGVDLLSLPVGTQLVIGSDAVIELTGLRNPCKQLNNFQDGLMQKLVYKDDTGQVVRLSGVMSIVTNGGTVKPGDAITITLPPIPHRALERV